ncbi:hypothetical protein CVT26_000930 [Gymnopilus dilepis]|uniref:Uncharacterized protein n=1 Tax=Gymnopilus dilepis TaxID=231916 RepID=A0A409VI28_9AGAR|nr:hypothetical protein CVT26_000930 [Gymnopilus dilepis]
MTSQPNESTLSLESTTTVNSTTPLRQPLNPPKDFEAALGALQSRYGAGGMNVPNPKKDPSNKLPGSSNTTPTLTPRGTPGSSQTTLGSSSVASDSSGGSSSNSGSSSGSSRKKAKDKAQSMVRSLFKGTLLPLVMVIAIG